MSMLTGMFAADERVKKAETPDSRSTMKVSGYGLSCVATQTMKGLSTKRDEGHGAEQHEKKLRVLEHHLKPSVASVWDTRPKMPIGAKRITICTIEGDGRRGVAQHDAGLLAGLPQDHAHGHRPGEDADVVRVRNGAHGIVDHVEKELREHLGDFAGRR